MNEKFLEEWFGVDGRELGCPERFYTDKPQDLLRLVQDCRKTLQPCYVSVQPYSGPDKPCALEKLYYDFDCKEDPNLAWTDVTVFSSSVKRFYGAEPLVFYSGQKGFHVYVFLKQTIYFNETPLAFAKQVYTELQTRLIKGLSLPTLDPQPIGDIKRLARVPFSIHEKTGSLCVPMDVDRKPFTPESLDTYKTLNAELLAPIIKELKTREKIASTEHSKPSKALQTRTAKGIRPCITAALSKHLEGGRGHLMRLAVVREYLAAGYNTAEIVQLFRSQLDYNPEKTRYYVEYAQKNPAKPFRCKTIQALGFCLPDCKRSVRAND
jgi:hypothetical protein